MSFPTPCSRALAQCLRALCLGLPAPLFQASPCTAATLEVPAFTAYFDPDPDAGRLSAPSGIHRWTDPGLTVNWFGQFPAPAEWEASVSLTLPEGDTSRLELSTGSGADATRQVTVRGDGTNVVVARFGRLPVSAAPGFQRFTLRSLNPAQAPAGDIVALRLDGASTNGVHFNLQPRRNAASVHLAYPVGKGTNVAAFYCELTAVEDPVYTYYMACGWHRGYFGMQVNGPTERRIIFSVWDSGDEAVDRAKVGNSNRVTLVARGEGVVTGDFGNEGTGGHSHLVCDWKTGERQRFVVTAQPTDTTHTVYSGYYFHPGRQAWMLVSSWNAPKEGGYMRGLYSFSENFGGSNGHLLRKVRAGNQWIRTPEDRWIEITTAKFSHDATGRGDRLDRFMGVENGEFFLSHGGFVPGFTRRGDPFTRPALGNPPELKLPPLPASP